MRFGLEIDVWESPFIWVMPSASKACQSWEETLNQNFTPADQKMFWLVRPEVID